LRVLRPFLTELWKAAPKSLILALLWLETDISLRDWESDMLNYFKLETNKNV
jgi:hypothetical protein